MYAVTRIPTAAVLAYQARQFSKRKAAFEQGWGSNGFERLANRGSSIRDRDRRTCDYRGPTLQDHRG